MLFIYDLIEELCMQKGITVTTLCRECKIPRSTMSDYKKGRIKSLSANTICKIADYFNVSVGYLMNSPFEAANEEELKSLIFGKGVIVTEEMWSELKNYAEFLVQKYKK